MILIKFLDIEPRHFGALSGQARIFIKLQEYEKAIKSIENALKFLPHIHLKVVN